MEKIKQVQKIFLDFLDEDETIEERYQNLIDIIDIQNIDQNKYELKSLFYLIANVGNNHSRSLYFFYKLGKLLKYLRNEDTKSQYSNREIFDIFHKNKRILLFLIKEKMLIMDKSLAKLLTSDKYKNMKYHLYFLPEIKQFIDYPKLDEFNEIPDDFEEKREKGENDDFICEIIRSDNVNQFDDFINKTNFSLESCINPSVYETNIFLIKRSPSLIEYATFYGSIHIFNYLFEKGVNLTPSLWIYAVHSNKLEMINLLEKNKVGPEDATYEQSFLESIKCHHIEISNYILQKLMGNSNNAFAIESIIHYYNFAFFPDNIQNIGNEAINFLCKYDHCNIIQLILEMKKIDIKKALKYARKGNKNEMIRLLLSSSNDEENKIDDDTFINLKPFSLWEQSKGKMQLTKIARKLFLQSKNPCIIMEFGDLRTGKSTIASHIIGGPCSDFSKTLFKTAGSSSSCTREINAVGPIKCRQIASAFGLTTDYNPNFDRDIFIVDSEGLNAFDGETPWLMQALLAMLPINTVTLYVAKSINKNDLNQFMKYLKLIRVIGGMEIHHGLIYVNNQERFDGSNVIEQLIEQNKRSTKYLIDSFSQSSIQVDDSHFKCLSVLQFEKHKKEFFTSLKEIVKFIVDLCINDKAVLSGEMVVNMLEEFVDKSDIISDIYDPDKTFETIFLQVVENAMNKSIEEQIPQIKNEIIKKLIEMPIQKLKLLDINDYMNEVENVDLIDNITNNAINQTFPDINNAFPIIAVNSHTKAIDIVKDTIINERKKILEKNAMEIHNLGSGFSIADASFKKQIFNINYNQECTEKKFNDNVKMFFHLPEFTKIDIIPIEYQKYKSNQNLSFNEYISNIEFKIRGNGELGFKSSKIGLGKVNTFANNLLGTSFSINSPESNLTTLINAISYAQVYFDPNIDYSQYLTEPLQNKIAELEDLLNTENIKSSQVKNIIADIYSNYGEFVATGFNIGCYEIDILHNDKVNFESSGSSFESSTNGSSNGLKICGISFNHSNSNVENKEISDYSKQIISSHDHTKVSYGNLYQPIPFIFDLIQNQFYGSSFVPLFKYVKSNQVANALEYWIGRWNGKPESCKEYCFINDIESIPPNQKIKLYHRNLEYEVLINNEKEIVIPDCQICYNSDEGEIINDVVLNPSKMTISGFKFPIFSSANKIKTGYKKRKLIYKHRHVTVNLSPFWEFEHEITRSLFFGDGIPFMQLNNVSSRSFSVSFGKIPEGSGKRWNSGPYTVDLQQNLKVKLA